MKTQMLKRLSSFVLMGVLIATLIPAFIASAADWDFVVDGNYTLVQVPSTFTSYFYRVGVADTDTDFTYGYGYGLSGGVGSYGYGYGYGYGRFQSVGNGGTLVAGNFYTGFFTSGGTLSATTTLPGVSAGVTTLSFPVTLGGGTGGITGVKVLIPAATLTGSNSSWTGTLTASSGTTIPAALSGMSSGSVVTLDPGIANMTITLSDEAIIKIPSATFSGLAVQLVQILDGAGAVYTVSACSSTQFTGSSTSTTDLEDSAKYTLSNPSTDVIGAHCYVFYNPTGTADDAIFVATRHFSSFAAGLGTASTTATTASGGGGGGSSGSATVATTTKTKTPVDKTTLTDRPDTTDYFDAEGKGLTVNNFADLKGIPQTDWRYKTVERIAPTGLFQGENVNGKRMFNMTSGMNRAMSAMVVARYVGCDVGAVASENPFSDVKKDAWYASAVGCLKRMGVVNGKTPTVYAPGDLVTRAEFFKLMTEAYMVLYPEVEDEWRRAMGSAKATFADVKDSDWFVGYVNFAYEKGLLTGYVEGGKRYAKGNQTVIRIEAAKMVVNYLDL
ncbi:S-layer homology domain-containing protein [Candidatus Peregrinibacteria bacterium]|nr:S-layer homology domain-containing protein [Candidatus Peregrinibacteria bacterium]